MYIKRILIKKKDIIVYCLVCLDYVVEKASPMHMFCNVHLAPKAIRLLLRSQITICFLLPIGEQERPLLRPYGNVVSPMEIYNANHMQ